MSKLITRLMADESGASSVEYAILVALVGAAAVIAIGAFGTGLGTVFANLVTKMEGWIGT